jgi:hypothetical protein
MATAIMAVWFVAALLFLAWLYAWWLGHRQRAYLNRNELFKVRTQLVKLVAQQRVSPDDVMFRNLYELVNISIANTRAFNLIVFAMAAREMRVRDRISSFVDDPVPVPPELREVAVSYFEALAKILLRNSLLLRTYLRVVYWTRRSGLRVKQVIPWLYEAGEIERACQRGMQRLAQPV